uniref:Uncharacterized protein n=1 Tax=Hemiselmis andersenii TaxID=464988 RepID=A0A7S1MXG3_HEMAN|mmetsp:Transcript_63224/g.151980  ORF Transcript_63224/g.151980 Transcript_63224/m.151980 type:complete len:135 (+) Transcript_63224:1-405(+)
MVGRYGVRSVFVASDSEEVVEEAREMLGSGIDVVSLAGKHRNLMFDSNLYIEFRMQMGLTDRRAVTESSLLDLMLLSHSDYFIGTFSSAFSAVAYELSVASKGYMPPYISLDIPWKPFLPFDTDPDVSMQNPLG